MNVVKGPDSEREETIRQMIEEHQRPLLRMCYLYLHDVQLAEDAVQETFLKAYRAWDGFRGASGVKTWLTRIAIRTCMDMRRVLPQKVDYLYFDLEDACYPDSYGEVQVDVMTRQVDAAVMAEMFAGQ